MALKDKGYVLLKAIDGEEALELAVRERPALILMDIQLPKLDGLEVTKKLRENEVFNHTPIIGITAYAMKGDKERVIESGCDVYLSKPIDIHELARLIDAMLLKQKPSAREITLH